MDEAEAFGREMVVRNVRISRGETDLIPQAPAMIDFGELGPDKVFKNRIL